LGQEVGVSRFRFAQYPDNPMRLFFPSEMAQKFSYQRTQRAGATVHPYGFLETEGIYKSKSGKTGGKLVGTKIKLRFYDATNAQARREVEVILQADASGRLVTAKPKYRKQS